MSRNISRIVFVWNADFSIAGGMNAIKEVISGHHTCTLCEIAYHRVTQTKEFTAYKRELAQQFNADIRQPCRNQLSKKELLAANGDFPTVLAHIRGSVIKLLTGADIDGCNGEFVQFRALLDKAIAQALHFVFESAKS